MSTTTKQVRKVTEVLNEIDRTIQVNRARLSKYLDEEKK